MPRFWNENAIRKDRARFEDILKKWYYKNNTIWQFKKGKWKKKVLPKDETSIAKRVKSTIDNILNEADPTNEANIGFGYGRSKHFRHRKLDIPNHLVWDFIMQDPLAIMKTYTARIAPRLEFRRQFGADLEDIAFRLERDMINKNVSEKEMRKHMRDFHIMYDRIAGAVLKNPSKNFISDLRNPSAMSQRIAYVMKEAAATNYMGSGFVAAIPEFGRVIMEHDGDVMIKAMQAILDKDIRMKSAKEIRLAGEAIDILKGSAFARLVDDMANNVDAPEFWNKARNAFYTLNGLGPITQLSKTLDGIARGHTIIDRSIKLSKNKATPFEIEWLARYGIDEKKAKEIARAPWQETQGGLYVANTDEWSTSFLIPEIEGNTVKVIEANEDGSPVGISRGKRYVPASYNAKTNTINFDREYIEGTQFDEKAWLSPKVEGVDALPDIFESPKDWSNFVMLHEIMHTRFSAKDLGFSKTSTVIKEVPKEKKVVGFRRKKDIDTSGTYFVHFTRKQNVESLLKNGYDVKRKSMFPLNTGEKLAGDVMYFTQDPSRWKYGDVRVKKGTGTEDFISYDYKTQEYVTVEKGLKKEKLEPVGAYLSKDAKVLVIDSTEKYLELLGKEKQLKDLQGLMKDLKKYLSEFFLDAVHLIDRGDGGWDIPKNQQFKDKYGKLVTSNYPSVSLGSGKSDFFVFNKDKVTFEKEVFEETITEFKKVKSKAEEKDVAGYENAINKLALEEYRRQKAVQQETVDTFRSAMNSGVLNTILAATPADRPIINDGVVFVPYHIAKNFGYKEDKTVKGYARIENGLLALPFQFYSYTFANVNKMVGAMAHGQLKNRAIGLTTMLGLGYLSVKLRYSLSGAEFAWEDMSAQDRVARAWDASGITALYSDLFYQSMHTSLALGGPNISNGILAPKFPQEPNVMDAITNVAGAGPSITTDIGRGVVDFASGNYGEGAKQVVRNLPFARMWFWKDDMNAITRMWAQ